MVLICILIGKIIDNGSTISNIYIFCIAGDIQSSNSNNCSNNYKNKQKLLLQETFAANSRVNNPSMSHEFPEKHLSLQMETLPEGFVNSNLSGGGPLTKKDFHNYQQCNR